MRIAPVVKHLVSTPKTILFGVVRIHVPIRQYDDAVTCSLSVPLLNLQVLSRLNIMSHGSKLLL